MSRILRSVFVVGVMVMAFALSSSRVDSKVVKDPPSGSKGLTIKSFTGILTGPGSVGTLQKLGYIDFTCDPKSLNWHIKVKGYSEKGQGSNTLFIGDPGVCDHVEVVMYYDPNKTDGWDGTAISVRKIP